MSQAGAGSEPQAGDATLGGEAGRSAAAGSGSLAGSPGDGGTGGAPEGSGGAAGACEQACTTMNAGGFCGPNTVTWLCQAGYDFQLFNSQCTDAATGAIRYCCPPDFKGECP